MSSSKRFAVLLIITVFAVIAMLFVDPIAQDPLYHDFADARPLLGWANFADTWSNAGFFVVGLLGLITVLKGQSGTLFESKRDSIPYVVFFTSVIGVSLGSAYYHDAPDNARLFWDRLPMTVGFMSLTAALIADRIDKHIGITMLQPLLIGAAILSLFYWQYTEEMGRGDLRFYALVQFLPILLMPVLCTLFPTARHMTNRGLLVVVLWYMVAKILEHFDAQVFDLLAKTISGHTLKHFAAAMACLMVLRMLKSWRPN